MKGRKKKRWCKKGKQRVRVKLKNGRKNSEDGARQEGKSEGTVEKWKEGRMVIKIDGARQKYKE